MIIPRVFFPSYQTYQTNKVQKQSIMAHSSSSSRKSCLQIEVEKVKTQNELYEYIRPGKYAGATTDPEGRAYKHERDFKKYLQGRRVMYCSKTSNMKKAEDRILKQKDFLLNSHKSSNADDEPGYVYIIV